jgi:hypothetical protein
MIIPFFSVLASLSVALLLGTSAPSPSCGDNASLVSCVVNDGGLPLEDGDALCQLSMKYEGPLGDPIWVALEGSCAGTCPSTAPCELKDTGEGSSAGSTIITIVECRCKNSGGGNGGCRGQEVRTSTDGGQTISSREMQCVGSNKCQGRTTCDFKTTTAPTGQSGTWATCACQ